MKIALIGGRGRMGSAVAEVLREKGYDFFIIGREDDFSRYREADLLIEFTSRDATASHIERVMEEPRPYIIGTTGLTDDDVELLRRLSEKVPVLLSYNFSIGINVLLKFLGSIASSLEGYDVAIVEKHHRFKKDKPSGTARLLESAIREGANVPVDVHALRMGGIFGEHTVIFASQGEVIEITHRALSRRVFAEGVIRAIEFIRDKEKGFYTMGDVI